MDTRGHSAAPPPRPPPSRAQALQTLGREHFDVLVVGGGIIGAGVARDAALRGLKVAVVDKGDWASGTSSRSTKLVHGGLRYLEHLELKLVFESVNERTRLMRLARHLVRPLPFLVTNYRGDRRWLATLDAGLWLYDALCLFRNYKGHRTHGAQETLALEPGLKRDGLNGGVLYYDALTDDARLTLENILDAEALGAVAVNHARAEKLLHDASRNLQGVTVRDVLTGEAVEARARLVVAAVGPWSDEVRELTGLPPLLAPTKGVHLVVDAARLPVRHALTLTAPRDGRVVFIVPWGLGRTVVGTTDTFHQGGADGLQPDAADIGYLLEVANHFVPEARLTPDDVLSTWSGLRPLLRPEDTSTSASAVSREHVIIERPGFLTMAGGKLTTYRKMSEELVDRAARQLGQPVRAVTEDRPLPGSRGLEGGDEQLDALARQVEAAGLDAPSARAWVELYGVRAVEVARRLVTPADAARLDEELPYRLAQVDEAVLHEHAVTLDDVLSRRLPLLLRGRTQGLREAPRVAERMAALLGWSPERVEAQLKGYRRTVEASRAFRA